MSTGLVEDDPAEAAVDDHGHDTCGAGVGVQHGDGLGGGLAGGGLHIHTALEQLVAHHRAGGVAAGLAVALGCRTAFRDQPYIRYFFKEA